MARSDRPFIKVDVDMPDHPKIEALSDRAFRHLFRLWTWCWKHDTDGEITPARWRKLPQKVRHELVTCGLVDDVGGVLVVHDYLDRQQSSEERRQASGKQSKGGSLAMHNRWHEARGVIKPGCSYCDSAAPSTADSTHKSPYNPGNKVPITEQEKEKELRDLSSQAPVGDAPANGPAPRGPGSSAAFQIVLRTIGHDITSTTRTALAFEVQRLMPEVGEPTIVDALQRWNSRSGIGPKMLPGLVDDIRKEARGATTHAAPALARPSTTDQRVAAAQALKAQFATNGATVLQLPSGDHR